MSRFEQDIEKVLGDQIRASDDMAEALWAALANIDWFHKDGDQASYSWREAGGLIVDIRGSGSYLDWYMCRRDGMVRQDIEQALAAEGWSYKPM